MRTKKEKLSRKAKPSKRRANRQSSKCKLEAQKDFYPSSAVNSKCVKTNAKNSPKKKHRSLPKPKPAIPTRS